MKRGNCDLEFGVRQRAAAIFLWISVKTESHTSAAFPQIPSHGDNALLTTKKWKFMLSVSMQLSKPVGDTPNSLVYRFWFYLFKRISSWVYSLRNKKCVHFYGTLECFLFLSSSFCSSWIGLTWFHVKNGPKSWRSLILTDFFHSLTTIISQFKQIFKLGCFFLSSEIWKAPSLLTEF